MAEGILKTCIKYAPIAIEDPENYEARANLMWASSLAINGLISYGEDAAWAVHPMEMCIRDSHSAADVLRTAPPGI